MNDSNTLQIPPYADIRVPPAPAAPAAPEPAPAPAALDDARQSVPAPREAAEPASERTYLLALLGITILGGILRFIFIDRPALWGDDGFTFMRICGTYQQMLDALVDWGFAPLHYELYWWIKQQTTMTPLMMRIVPGIAGTLMAPAMYWLGRELVNRKVGLVAALIAATSAYLLNYSRDAKMYMHFWLMCTVNFAALLWWLRTRQRIAWWSWVASGVAMLGLNMLGVAVLVLGLVAVVLTRDAHWRSLGKFALLLAWLPLMVLNGFMRLIGASFRARPPLDRWFNRTFANFRWPPMVPFLLGVAIMLVGPLGYYLHFNQYEKRLDERGMAGGGLGWVEGYNRGRDTFDLIAFTTTAHLYSWEWPRYHEDAKGRVLVDDSKEIAPRAVKWLKIAGISILTLLAIGLFPWPRAWTAFANAHHEGRFWIWPLALTIVLAWIVVPAYGFYCASVRNFLSPLECVANLVVKDVDRVNWPTLWDTTWWPFEIERRGRVTSGTGYLVKFPKAWEQFTAQLDSSNLRRPTSWMHWALLVGGVAFAVGAFILSGRSMRERIYKLTVLVTIFLALYAMCWLVFVVYVERYKGSVWMPRYLGFAWPALALVVATLLLRLPTRPLRWGAIALLVGVNLAVFSARLFAGNEVPTPLMARDLIDSQPADATTRMYYNVNVMPSGAPGTGYLWSLPGAYYLTIYSGKPTTPDEFRSGFTGGKFASNFKRWDRRTLPIAQYVINDVRKNDRLSRIIVWQNFQPKRDVPQDDPVLERLGSNWKRADQEIFYVRDHWTWRNQMTLRRRVYERIAAPAPAPTTAPSTSPTTAPK